MTQCTWLIKFTNVIESWIILYIDFNSPLVKNIDNLKEY